jgi:hypothetical protein
MGGNKLFNIADPVNSSDAVNKKHLNTKVNKTGDEMSGNLILKLLGKNFLSLGCNDLRAGKRFSLLLRNTQNVLYSQLNQPVSLQTSNGINYKVADGDIVKFSASNIMFHEDVYMDDCHISNLKSPASASDAATKGYVDTRIPPSTAQFQSLLADASGNYYAASTPDTSQISNSLPTRQFDDLPTGLYATFTSYLPPERLGILPTNTKGYLVCIAYQINQAGIYNKRYQWTSADNQTYYAWINESTWYTWINRIENIGNPIKDNDTATKGYVDSSISGNVKLDGSTVMRGSLNMGWNTITHLVDPSNANDAVNKQYVDNNYVSIGNIRSRLIGNGTGRPAAPGIFEILISATKPVPRNVKLVLFHANNIIMENIDDDATSDGTTSVIRHKTVAIVDIHGNDDGHIKQYIELITENGSRYLRMGYTSSKTHPDILNINFVLLSQNSDRVNINRISVEAYSLVCCLPAVLPAALKKIF